MKRLLALVAALMLFAAPALAQEAQEVEIVDINGSRYPENGATQMIVEFRNFAEDPDPAAVEVTANGQAVNNLTVEPIGNSTVPVGVVLAIDASGSMAGEPIAAAQEAARSFVAQARAEDRIAILSFADEVLVLSGFTNNKDALNATINSIVADGETSFNDAVIRGIQMFDEPGASNLLGNLIVLSDGEDTASEATFDEALAAVEGSDARTFGVALEGSDFNPEPVQAIATAGGGLFLSTPDPTQLSGLYDQIGREISNTMVARFESPISTPGDVEFNVGYQGLTSTQTFAVSGFAVTTTIAEGSSTTTTLAPLTTVVVESNSPLSLDTLLLIGAAGLGLTLFLFLIILFGREDDDDPGRFSKRLQAYGRKGQREATEEGKSWMERIPLLNRFSAAAEEEVKKRGLLSGVNSTLEQANVPMTPGEAIMAMLGLAAVIGIMMAIFNGIVWGVIAFGGLLFLLVAGIRYAGNRERRKFENQLPDTLTLMSTSLRAGYSLLQATEAVSSEAPDPTAREFGRAIAEARLGRTVTQALEGVVDRTQSSDFEWAVMAIEIQREVGGNLAEVLQTVADTMRARNRLKGEIRALTAEGRISAIVLGSLPFLMFLFLWTTNRSYLQPLLDETFGRIALGVGILLIAGGLFWLKKIVDIEI
ncbi:MAG TPA: type II secretion system F family protein [Acidimicrobiia bacterium]|nr:type II secretion system F family protein [Acidimicrobiia bacterium]